MTLQPSSELRALMDLALAHPTPDLPAPWPVAGQTRDDWAAEVAAVRAAHEAWASEVATAVGGEPTGAPVVEVGAVSDVVANGVPARIYAPPGEGPFPVLVMFHGGGFWIGGGPVGMAAADPSCRLLCLQLTAVVVNVDYRQAPEHRFPVPLEDCYSATTWVSEHAEELGVDATRLVVIGPSAGANLAAGVTLLARDRGGPPIRFAMLMVPTLDATLASPSIVEKGQGYDLTEDYIRAAWDLHLGTDGDRTDPLVSPLLADDLSGLPATHVVVGDFDPLCDDGVRYATRLQEAGIEVTSSRFAMGHTVVTPDVGADYLLDVMTALTRALVRT